MINGRVKIVLLGGANTGKSAILCTYYGNPYHFNPTIGVEVSSSMLVNKREKSMVRFYDMGGAKHWWYWIPTNIQHADFIFLFYDVTNQQSLTEAGEILDIIVEKKGSFRIILVGNKTDLEEQRVISIFDANAFIQKWQAKGVMLSHIETNVHNITAFKKIIKNISSKMKRIVSQTSFNDNRKPAANWSQWTFGW